MLALSALAESVTAQGAPDLTFTSGGLTFKGHFQGGFNAVSEQNLFWNLSDTFAAQSGFDPDATWLESYIKPGISISTDLGDGLTLFGKISAVASHTMGQDAFDANDTGRVLLEEGHIGLRGQIGEARFDISAGPRELKLGSGMLIANGASNGFERGALKFGPRKAWEMAGIARLSSGPLTATAFYLEPNELPTSNSNNQLIGGDLRYDGTGGGFLGATFVHVLQSDAPYPQAAPGGVGAPVITPGDRDGTNTIGFYARTEPFEGPLQGAFVTADLAIQWNPRIDLRAYAGRIQAGYAFNSLPWKPVRC